MIKVEDIYPITSTKYPGNHQEIKFIKSEHLREYTAPIKYIELVEFLDGQTAVPGGVYPQDVERWLNKLPVID